MTLYIGLDVHGKQTVYVAQDEAGKVTAQGKVATSAEGFCELVKGLEAPKGTKIGLETGAQAMWVSRLLSGLGTQPVAIDAREVRQKARPAEGGIRSVTAGTRLRFAMGCVGTSTPRSCMCRSPRSCDCGRFCPGVATL